MANPRKPEGSYLRGEVAPPTYARVQRGRRKLKHAFDYLLRSGSVPEGTFAVLQSCLTLLSQKRPSLSAESLSGSMKGPSLFELGEGLRKVGIERVLFDRARHLVCEPYSVGNLHEMAAGLGIKRCWFHPRPYPHYDIPKSLMRHFLELAEDDHYGESIFRLVTSRQILLTIKYPGPYEVPYIRRSHGTVPNPGGTTKPACGAPQLDEAFNLTAVDAAASGTQRGLRATGARDRRVGRTLPLEVARALSGRMKREDEA